MNPFRIHTGLAAALDRLNIDTDQIIPKQFLKRIERTGFGQFLFNDWRFREDGTLDPDFELNDPAYQGASILVAGRNFGCGSSREHAPWALQDYGFRAVLAPSSAGDWRIVQDADDQTAYDALAVDRLWNGYGIADLVPPFRPYSRVAVARRGASPPEAACLVLRHPAFNALIPHGDADGVSALL